MLQFKGKRAFSQEIMLEIMLERLRAPPRIKTEDFHHIYRKIPNLLYRTEPVCSGSIIRAYHIWCFVGFFPSEGLILPIYFPQAEQFVVIRSRISIGCPLPHWVWICLDGYNLAEIPSLAGKSRSPLSLNSLNSDGRVIATSSKASLDTTINALKRTECQGHHGLVFLLNLLFFIRFHLKFNNLAAYSLGKWGAAPRTCKQPRKIF